MDIKPLYSTRFLPTQLVAALIIALAGCSSAPEKPVVEEEPAEVVMLPPAAPVSRPVELKPDYPQKYVVVKGDTLWDISARFLMDPWMWPQLWYYNPQISNPHLIYPGDILTIIFIDGKPVMQVTRNGRVVTGATALPPEVARSGQSYPTVKLSPRIREQGLDNAIPTISIDAIGPFLSRPRIVSRDELEQAPYVMAHEDDRMMSGGGYKIYARGLKEQGLQGDYVAVRAGQVYRNPKNSDDVLGYEAIYLGDVRLTRFGDPSTMQVTDSAREILRGDRLIPKGDEVREHSFAPQAPAQRVDGEIIAVLDGVNMIGPFQVVVLNLGRQDDVVPGHVLAVNQAGNRVQDIVAGGDRVTLPTERAGTVMIFRVFDRVSYALVMDATRTIHLHDQVTNP
jgi:hypothetical protein